MLGDVGLRDIISNLRSESQSVEQAEEKIEKMEQEEASELKQRNPKQAAREEREIIELLEETEEGVVEMLQMEDSEFKFFEKYLDTEADIRKRQLQAIRQTDEFTNAIEDLIDELSRIEQSESVKRFLASYVAMQEAQESKDVANTNMVSEGNGQLRYVNDGVRTEANEVKEEIVRKASDQGVQAIKQDIQRQCERTKEHAQSPNFPAHPSGVDAADQVLRTMESQTSPIETLVEYGEVYREFVEALKGALDSIKKVKNQEQRLMMNRDRFDMDESAIDSIKQDTETSISDIQRLRRLLEEEDELDTVLNQEAQDSTAHQALRSVEGNLSEIAERLDTLEERIRAIENQENNIESFSTQCEENLNELLELFKDLNEKVLQESDMLTKQEKSNISTYIGNLESILEEVMEEYEYDENRLDHEEKTSRKLDQEIQELDEKFQ